MTNPRIITVTAPLCMPKHSGIDRRRRKGIMQSHAMQKCRIRPHEHFLCQPTHSSVPPANCNRRGRPSLTKSFGKAITAPCTTHLHKHIATTATHKATPPRKSNHWHSNRTACDVTAVNRRLPGEDLRNDRNHARHVISSSPISAVPISPRSSIRSLRFLSSSLSDTP